MQIHSTYYSNIWSYTLAVEKQTWGKFIKSYILIWKDIISKLISNWVVQMTSSVIIVFSEIVSPPFSIQTRDIMELCL